MKMHKAALSLAASVAIQGITASCVPPAKTPTAEEQPAEGLTGDQLYQIQQLAWPQLRSDIEAAYGLPDRFTGRGAVYELQGQPWDLLILVDGGQATGYEFIE